MGPAVRRAIAVIAAILALAMSAGDTLAAAGSWTIVPSPNLHAGGDWLVDVTCLGTSDCWAIGQDSSGLGQNYFEHNVGNGWVLVPGPTLSGGGHSPWLAGLACVTSSNCWAVGNYVNAGNQLTLIEHYNGRRWIVVSSPSPDPGDQLLAVACVNAGSCWAVGDGYPATGRHTLIEQYVAGAWMVSGTSLSTGQLDDIACVKNVDDCWAVGEGGATPGLAVHNSGRGWVVVRTANVQNAALTAVTCASAINCWAVGTYTAGSTQPAMTEHFDGRIWTVVPIGHPANSTLSDVSCVAAADCWAVGYRYELVGTQRVFRTLSEHNRGSGWVHIVTPNGPGPNYLFGLACVTTRFCWAVGNSSGKTLAEQYIA